RGAADIGHGHLLLFGARRVARPSGLLGRDAKGLRGNADGDASLGIDDEIGAAEFGTLRAGAEPRGPAEATMLAQANLLLGTRTANETDVPLELVPHAVAHHSAQAGKPGRAGQVVFELLAREGPQDDAKLVIAPPGARSHDGALSHHAHQPILAEAPAAGV